MKFSFIILLVICQQIPAIAFSQHKKISLKLTDVKLTKAFDIIEKKSGYRFLYNSEAVPINIPVNIQVQDSSLAYVLDKVITGNGLIYKIINDKVIAVTSNTEKMQPIKIQGKVTDSAGKPLAGVTIKIKNTANGTTTDISGSFSLQVPDDGTLVFSYVGYKDKEVAVDNAKTALTVVLNESAAELNQVVVVGYGKQKKADLTGAVSTVSGDDLSTRPVGQTSAALEGTMPGVTVTQTNGRPGADGATIRIRGIGTLDLNNTGKNNPLVLIDGVEGSMDNIDPNLIASVTALKDAASSSIYGSRAANGVILVTTKRGKGGHLSVNYNNYFGWQKASGIPKIADALNYILLLNEAYVNAGRSPLYSDDVIAAYRKQGSGSSDSFPNTDWSKEVLIGSGFQQNHFITVSAGNDKIHNITSVGYFDQKGLVKNSEFKRFTLRSNTDIIFSKKFNAQFDIQFINPITIGSGAGTLFHWMNNIPPTLPWKNENGTWGVGWRGLNPVAVQYDAGTNKNTAPNGSINASINYKPVNWLTLAVTVAPKMIQTYYNAFSKTVKTYYPDSSLAYLAPNVSSLNVSSAREFYNNTRGTATFDKMFGEHSVKLMGGVEQNSYHYDNLTAYRDGYVLPQYAILSAGSANNLNNSGTASEWALLSYFGRLNYNYKEKYLLEVNGRYDGSSSFAPGNKWGFFPSASAGWRISEEAFMKPLKNTINDLKLRASWGKLGNQNIGTYPAVTSVDLGSYTFGGTIVNMAALNNLSNPNITWESTEISDIGLDISLFSHLSITADYYVKKTNDILLQLNIPLTIGLNAPYQNAGKVNNKGWE